jgi:hypothetical protein
MKTNCWPVRWPNCGNKWRKFVVSLNKIRRDLSELKTALGNASTGKYCSFGVTIVREYVLGEELPPAFPKTCETCGKPYGEDAPRLLIEIEVVDPRRREPTDERAAS